MIWLISKFQTWLTLLLLQALQPLSHIYDVTVQDVFEPTFVIPDSAISPDLKFTRLSFKLCSGSLKHFFPPHILFILMTSIPSILNNFIPFVLIISFLVTLCSLSPCLELYKNKDYWYWLCRCYKFLFMILTRRSPKQGSCKLKSMYVKDKEEVR